MVAVHTLLPSPEQVTAQIPSEYPQPWYAATRYYVDRRYVLGSQLATAGDALGCLVTTGQLFSQRHPEVY